MPEQGSERVAEAHSFLEAWPGFAPLLLPLLAKPVTAQIRRGWKWAAFLMGGGAGLFGKGAWADTGGMKDCGYP